MTAVHSIDQLLEGMQTLRASDLHISAGSAPAVRVRGEMNVLEELPEMTPDDTQQLLYRILNTEQQKRLEVDRQIDLSYAISGVARFRVNVFFQRNAVAAVFRLIPYKILTLEELSLPGGLQLLARLGRLRQLLPQSGQIALPALLVDGCQLAWNRLQFE